jgi:hypothetical protein
MNTLPRDTLLLLAAVSVAAASLSAQQAAQLSAPKSLEEAWRAGLQRMRAQKAPGLVFVLPAADQPLDSDLQARFAKWPRGRLGGPAPSLPKTAREQFLWTLNMWRDPDAVRAIDPGKGATVDLLVLFALAVPIVAEAEVCGAKPGETLVLLKADGTRDDGFAVHLADSRAVADALASGLLSEAALAARRAAMPPAVRQAAADWERMQLEPPAEHGVFLAARQKVQASLHAAAPALVTFGVVEAGDPAKATKLARASAALRAVFDDTVPLGTEVGETWDPCPPCGMAAVPLPSRSLLRLLPK